MKMIISENDKRLYRLITLENGLRAMLVSSANSDDVEMREDTDEEMEDEATSESGSSIFSAFFCNVGGLMSKVW